jgi:hypothetical protein
MKVNKDESIFCCWRILRLQSRYSAFRRGRM